MQHAAETIAPLASLYALSCSLCAIAQPDGITLSIVFALISGLLAMLSIDPITDETF